ncbi:MAG TPA: N,N-dimethylformamidase beta subunit family domain-containing protein, partial [Mycobacteriales bacterium]
MPAFTAPRRSGDAGRSPSRWRRLTARTAPLLAVGMVPLAVALPVVPASAATPCDPPVTNKVACENTSAGTPESQWRVDGSDPSIAGYTTDISTNVGGRVDFKIRTDAASWRIDIYRLGWYGGDGARMVATVGPSVGGVHTQPACLTDSATGLNDCGNWSVSASWQVPTTAVSGLYYAVPHRDDTGGENEIFFVVRDDAS